MVQCIRDIVSKENVCSVKKPVKLTIDVKQREQRAGCATKKNTTGFNAEDKPKK